MTKSLSIVIPTLGRESVLVETIESLLSLSDRAEQIWIIDQTAEHESETTNRLQTWDREGQIRWIRLSSPSITKSMNHGLREAKTELVLFLDDDIRPRGNLVGAHRAAHSTTEDLWATVGQVIQPWQTPEDVEPPRVMDGLRRDEDFPFHATGDHDVENVMAGNLCVRRDQALSLGGFDENFQGVAYRFETEFARRIIKAGGRIRYIAAAGIDHLRVPSGGTRTRGSHLTSASPIHGLGDHYYAMLHASSNSEARAYCLRRIFREVRTKFHLKHPWWIPVKLLGEVRAFLNAKRLVQQRRANG